MTKCCKCSGAGTCVNCSCARKKIPCVNCAPGGKNKCKNSGNRLPFTTKVSSGTGGSESSPEPCTAALHGDHGATLSNTCLPGALRSSDDLNVESVESEFQEAITQAYEKVVHWRRNVFNVPFGAAGGEFVFELAALIKSFAEGTPSRKIAWKGVSVACHLLLQKPNATGSAQSHIQHLERRLLLWRSGQISQLFDECMCIQDHLPASDRAKKRQSEPSISDTFFSKLVFSGKIHSAIRYISQDSQGGILRMDDQPLPGSDKTVRDILLEKHPEIKTPPEHALMSEEPLQINPIVFDRLSPDLLRNVSRHLKGSAGPSGLDAEAWKRMLTCFKQSSNRLCAALAAAAHCLCTADLTGEDLSAFTASRLIPLNKNPGVRPIAVGEVFRRLICKAVMKVIEEDVLLATAPYQVCVGVPSACEAAVHTMDRLFRNPSIEGILLVDASNAFNALNRSAALHNIPRLCPALAQVFTNTYNDPIRLFVSGGGEISSEEGTCQGDPLAMAAYAVAISPMIKRLGQTCPSTTQCWYADDDGAADDLVSLRQYWSELEKIGPGYGYFPNGIKTILLTKPEHRMKAQRLFSDTGISIRSDGCRYLGGAVGEKEFCRSYMASMAEKWCRELRTLSEIAETQPHAAYAVFTKGLSTRWKYHIRSTECPPEAFVTLDNLINTALLPAFTGREFTQAQAERTLLSLPARLGGLAIPVLTNIVTEEYRASGRVTEPLVNLIAPNLNWSAGSGTDESCVVQRQLESGTDSAESAGYDGHQREVALSSSGNGCQLRTNPVLQAISESRGRARNERYSRETALSERTKSLVDQVSERQQFLIEIAKEKGVSSWLTADPSPQLGTILNKSDFRDAVSLRYGFSLDGLPTTCICGAEMSTDHALTCPSGGYPTARHNQVRDVVADAMRTAFQDVEVEPQLLPYENEDLSRRTANRSAEARVDIRARGFWTRQQEAFFDVRVTHPKATCLSRSQVLSQLEQHEREKKRQYSERINNIDRGVFTPLVFSTAGLAGRECSRGLKMLVNAIVDKNIDLSYSAVMGHLRCKLSFCLLKWNITCLRGCRASYRRNKGHGFLSECRLMAKA